MMLGVSFMGASMLNGEESDVAVLVDSAATPAVRWQAAASAFAQAVTDDDVRDRGLLDVAIESARGIVTIPAEASPERLVDFAEYLWARIGVQPRRSDLAEYCTTLRTAIAALDENESEERRLLARAQSNLAVGIARAAEEDLDASDRNSVIELWEAALGCDELDPEERGFIYENIALTLYRSDATEADLRRAVANAREGLELPGRSEDSDLALCGFGLASMLESLHGHCPDEGMLDESIERSRHGLRMLGKDHLDYPGYSAELAGRIRQRALELEDRSLLRHAREVVEQDVLPYVPDGHADRTLALAHAAAIYSDLAYASNDREMMTEAIALYREASVSGDTDDMDRATLLISMTAACREGSELHGGDRELLDEAVSVGDTALRLSALPGQTRAQALTATSSSLRDRFMTAGQIEDLRRARELSEEGLMLTPSGHPDEPKRKTNLAVILSDLYTVDGDRALLDRAIHLYRSALSAENATEQDTAERRNDLGLALRDYYRESGNPDDLREALMLVAAAESNTARGSRLWPGFANNHGSTLAEIYEAGLDPAALDLAIEQFTAAAEHPLVGPADAAGFLNNLALALASRAAISESANELDHAIDRLVQSISLLGPNHPELAVREANIASLHRQRSSVHQQAGAAAAALVDAELAVDWSRQSLEHAGEYGSRLLPALENLARSLLELRSLDHTAITADEVIAVRRDAAALEAISARDRFTQSALWAQVAADAGQVEEAARAYRRALALMTEVAWIGLTPAERVQLLRETGGVQSDALEFAIAHLPTWDALAWADQVRSVIWRQQSVLRAAENLDSKRTVPPLTGLIASRTGFGTTGASEREAHRRAAHDQASLLEIALPTPADYRKVLFDGVVVLLIPSDSGSTALLWWEKSEPVRMALPFAPRAKLRSWAEVVRDACATLDLRRSAEEETRARHRLFDCFDWLWETVAQPVLTEIERRHGVPTRLWLSPIGEFTLLPVHAAGRHPRKAARRYSKTDSKPAVLNAVPCTYLTTVLPTRSGVRRDENAPNVVLRLTGDNSDDSLPHLQTELDAVAAAVPDIGVTTLDGATTTTDEICAAIEHHKFVHIASHGASAAESLHGAGLKLVGGVLTMESLAALDARHGELAVVLACDSASGDPQTPNEALHVAGALQHAGFQDVLAATLPLRDSATLSVVASIYAALNENPSLIGRRLHSLLCAAVSRLRTDPTTSADPLAWAPFAHFASAPIYTLSSADAE